MYICGKTISHGGVGGLVQYLGNQIAEEATVAVSEMNADQAKKTL